ncbi:DUF6907 domain-containing protein [Streptomyces lanatus]|uniref:Uncharacterized protein n=1 Tax=Streptomyces lanatus TaxID=66900 RepID=A0ABV1XU91_9ACTN|nr:hypothetical protein [Streptomyces lanatus]GHH11393.1 hypothetical protein GCM10018780_48900 [Streptomyces lanatus]
MPDPAGADPMNTEPRKATLTVFVVKPLEIDEPDRCTGHSADGLTQYKVDISHDGPEHVIAPGGREMFRAFLTQAPFSSADRTVGLYIEGADITGTHTPHEVEQLADALAESADQLRALSRDLARILAQGED